MGSYGRNFEFRVPPVHGERGGRYVLGGSTNLPIGVPVRAADGADNDDSLTGALPVTLATGAQNPKKGLCGLLLFEHIDNFGVDPVLYTWSDRDTAPAGKMVQVISGDRVKIVLKNTADRTFLQVREYTGRTMVAGLGATPTLQVGDFLTPGVGNDSAGYWAEGNATNGWLVIENVDPNRDEVEARFNF